MGVSRRAARRRLGTVFAVVALGSFAWAGTAQAADSPIVPVPSLSGSDSQSSATESGTSTEDSSSSSNPEVEQTEDDAPAASPRALIGLPGTSGIVLPSTFPSFPTGSNVPTIPGLPAIDPGTDPVTACSQVVSTLRGLDPTQLSAALDAPAAIFCSAFGFDLPSLPTGDQSATGVTETVYAPPDFYDDGYGRRYYGSCGCDYESTTAATPVVATQVASVPSGGVNTGDGSYEGP